LLFFAVLAASTIDVQRFPLNVQKHSLNVIDKLIVHVSGQKLHMLKYWGRRLPNGTCNLL